MGTPSPSKKSVIAILGTNFSGSTMLGCALGSTPVFGEIFHVGELHAKSRHKRHLNFGCASQECCPYWEKIGAKFTKNFYRKLFASLPETRVIVDSSKDPAWFRKQLSISKNKEYDFHFIITYKKHETLLDSFLSRKMWYEKRERVWMSAYENNVNRFRECVSFLEDLNLPHMSVNIENFIRHPSNMLQKICNRTGIEYFDGKERYWEYEQHHFGGNQRQKFRRKDRNNSFYERKKKPRKRIKISDEESQFISELSESYYHNYEVIKRNEVFLS